MNHLDLLNVARALKCSRDEASRRSAVSRAYYAVYHHIKAYLVQNNLVHPKADLPHGKPREFFHEASKNSGLREFEVLSKEVDTLYQERRKADYKMSLTKFNKPTCCTLFNRCSEAIKLFDQHKGQDLIDGIRQHLDKIGYIGRPFR